MLLDQPFHAQPLQPATPVRVGAAPPRDTWPTFVGAPDRVLQRQPGFSDAAWEDAQYAAAVYWSGIDARMAANVPAHKRGTLSPDQRAEKNRVYQQQHRDRKKAPNAKALELLHVLQGLEAEELALRAAQTVLKGRILTARGMWQLACAEGADKPETQP